MKKLAVIAVAFLFSLSAEKAMAWSGFAHAYSVYIAEQHLTPEAKAKCRYYLRHTLPYYASWMDHWKGADAFKSVNARHSVMTTADGKAIDFTFDEYGKPYGVTPGECMGYLRDALAEMGEGKYKNLPDSLVRQRLINMVHYVADMHCPCHNVWPKESHPQYRYHLTNNKGGKESFHKFWDNTAITYGRKKWTATTYANKMATLSEKEIKKICKGTPYKWAVTSLPNAEATFELTPSGSNKQKYSKQTRTEMRRICDEEAVKAGYRLAYVMNQIFKK